MESIRSSVVRRRLVKLSHRKSCSPSVLLPRMSFKPVADLNPRAKNGPIEVRFYRKWIQYRSFNPTPFAYCCLFIDREGSVVQANTKFKESSYFDSVMKIGACYRLTNFITEPTASEDKIVPHEVQLELGRATKFEEIADLGFPHHYFNFISQNQLLPRLNKHEMLTDYIGRLRSISDVIVLGQSTKRTCVRRQLQFENLSGNTIKFTIWDHVTREFDNDAYTSLPQPVVAAISSVKVTKRNGHLQLTGTPATHVYLNPDIPEVADCLPEYKKLYNDDPPLQIQPRRFEDGEKERMRNRYPVAALKSQNPHRYMVASFSC